MGPGLAAGLDHLTGIAAADQARNQKPAGQAGSAGRGIQRLI
ncbi:hypothetical protein FIU95_20445 [Microbulbifer sp. THAF38]|nr:hypothetical protein FIU95_20445 [Microbulbifer sp. THAF38]